MRGWRPESAASVCLTPAVDSLLFRTNTEKGKSGNAFKLPMRMRESQHPKLLECEEVEEFEVEEVEVVGCIVAVAVSRYLRHSMTI